MVPKITMIEQFVRLIFNLKNRVFVVLIFVTMDKIETYQGKDADFLEKLWLNFRKNDP